MLKKIMITIVMLITPVMVLGATCDLVNDGQNNNNREITCDKEKSTSTQFKTMEDVEVLKNSVCRVTCNERLVLLVDPIKKALAGTSFSYPLYTSGERECRAVYEYESYSDRMRALAKEWGVADNNSKQKTLKVVFHRNASSGDTTTKIESFTTEDIWNRFGYDKNGKARYKTGDRQTGSFGDWSKSGYSLLGWSTNKNADTAEYLPYARVTDKFITDTINTTGETLHLYAIWKTTSTTDEVFFIKNTLKYHRNTSASDSTTLSQEFTLGKMINEIGYNTNGAATWAQSGQFGGWSRSGYVPLGWSRNSNAKTPEMDLYEIITDDYIRANQGTIDLYLVWGQLPTYTTSRKTDEIDREITNLHQERIECDNFKEIGAEKFNKYEMDANVNIILETSTGDVDIPYHYEDMTDYTNSVEIYKKDFDGCEINLTTRKCDEVEQMTSEWTETASFNGKYTMQDAFLELYTGKRNTVYDGKSCNAGDRYFVPFYEITKPRSEDRTDLGYKITLNARRLGDNMLPANRGNWNLTVNCHYQVSNLMYPQQDDRGNCIDENCNKYGTTAFEYRIVDLPDPFPSREPGANWKGREAIITSTKDNISSLLRFTINLNRSGIYKVRKYNELYSYDTFNLNEMEKSQFIINNTGIVCRGENC